MMTRGTGGRRSLPLGMDVDGDMVLADVVRLRRSYTCRRLSVIPPDPAETCEPEDAALSGQVRRFAPALRRIVRENGWKGRRVAICAPPEHVVLRRLTLPAMPERSLRLAVRSEVERRMQLPIQDPLCDFAVLSGQTTGAGARER